MIRQRSNPIRDVYARYYWSLDHSYCAACGSSGNEWGRWLTTHHLIKPGRSDEPTNLLRLCQRCHNLAELLSVRENGKALPKLTLPICLTLKALNDPKEFDAERLEILYGQGLPDMELPPKEFESEFTRRRGPRYIDNHGREMRPAEVYKLQTAHIRVAMTTLTADGIRVYLKGDQAMVGGPKEKVVPWLPYLNQHRDEIIQWLRTGSQSTERQEADAARTKAADGTAASRDRLAGGEPSQESEKAAGSPNG